jgi:hypothetical protein
MQLPNTVSAAEVITIVEKAGRVRIPDFLAELAGRRYVPAALVVAAAGFYDEQLLFHLAVKAYRKKPSRAAMLWINKTYIGRDPESTRRANIAAASFEPLWERVTTARMMTRPGGYDSAVFDDADEGLKNLLADINNKFRAIRAGSFSIPGTAARLTLEKELQGMARVGLDIG